MKKVSLLLLILLISVSGSAQEAIPSSFENDVQSIIDAAINSDFAFERLTYMGDTFGPRFSGSENLENSIDWIVEEMKSDGFDRVWTQPVKVPHWVRGEESAILNVPIKRKLPMLGLGGSVGTPSKGITGEVLVVQSFEELEERSEEAEGKIVLFNAEFTSYGQTVGYRVNGASEAAKHGAIASLIASVASYSIQTPHTGVMRYADGVKKIPHAAITVEDALLMQRLADRGEKLEVTLKMEAQTLPDADSRNVIAEIKGSEFPDEIIVLGGHIDSWDVGTGMMDDGGGCVAAWEALRLIKKLGLTPKRTIRVVLWTNEENGLAGANEYRRWVEEDEQSLNNHVLAMESDAGVFDPIGFGFTGSDEAFDILTEIGAHLESIESGEISKGGGGADIGPLMRGGVPGMGLRVNGDKYFWFHHTDADTIDKLNIDDFNECVATMAAFAYGVADLNIRLPR
ncbi:MAG: M20/M25/M40 family metallo-hydrolase [Balneolaceae bacterium]|nr:M20/M25/M40 family metallo-hydrolase [Balneolaceae bacterium]MBO6546310.1 M20/M25/M40 family metallo-hydrolase [Balneolaceae bacterium]MBO6648669.1 M20/M25/M40 family metallo-hydrolase [Balneolaceae bacterium]